MNKRKARANVILDFDDLILLYLLRDKKSHSITEIKKHLNFSHNALKNHVSRLEEWGMIEMKRYEKNYKKKYLILTKQGVDIYSILKTLPLTKCQ